MPVKTVLTSARVPVKIWEDSSQIEQGAQVQLINCANLPFVFKHVAAMPDVHWGMGATIGSVIPTKGAICPAAVGVDIGCGMMAVKTSLNHKLVTDKLPQIRHEIERSIPVGFQENRRIHESVEKWDGWRTEAPIFKRYPSLQKKAMHQLGSLGGGNHFIEVCLDTEENVWIMLHSGSRNVGKTAADAHIQNAKGLMKKMLIELPDPDLSYLPEETQEFKDYWADLKWCQAYAFQNRIEMMDRVLHQLAYLLNNREAFPTSMTVNCHHNYVDREHHFGENVLVTRKGAVRAREGELGIIPGSMGTRSYIVKGRGNPESFESCSHGAGRRMSRSRARKEFTVKDLESQTAGVECRKDEGVLDEIPKAYKDIDQVMANQTDLVEVVAQLKQVLCVKG